jgi:hypothetical protein
VLFISGACPSAILTAYETWKCWSRTICWSLLINSEQTKERRSSSRPTLTQISPPRSTLLSFLHIGTASELRRTRVERMNLNPLPNKTSLNPAIPANQLCPIPDLNEPPAEQEDKTRASGLATTSSRRPCRRGSSSCTQPSSTSEILRTRNLIRWANSSSAFAGIFAKNENLFG